jgi:hypothetical protein
MLNSTNKGDLTEEKEEIDNGIKEIEEVEISDQVKKQIDKAAQLIASSNNIVIFTGTLHVYFLSLAFSILHFLNTSLLFLSS